MVWGLDSENVLYANIAASTKPSSTPSGISITQVPFTGTT